MLIANSFLLFKNIFSSSFPVLNISAGFLHPNVGFALEKSYNLTFSLTTWPLLFYQEAVPLIVTCLEQLIQAFVFSNALYCLQFEVLKFDVWLHDRFYDIQNSQ